MRETWGKFSNDQLEVIAGKRDQLIGGLQEAYGILRDKAGVPPPACAEQQKDFENVADTASGPTKSLPPESPKSGTAA